MLQELVYSKINIFVNLQESKYIRSNVYWSNQIIAFTVVNLNSNYYRMKIIIIL